MEENTNITSTEETQATEPEVKATTSTEEQPTTSVEEQLQKLMVENAKMKRAFDKASSEAADYKKKYNATLSEKEQADLAKAEAEARRDERLAELERENSIHKFTESFLDLGYDKESAIAAATAQVDNDVDTLFKLQKKIIDAKVQAKVNELLAPKVSYYKKFNNTSIVDGLKSIGVDYSFNNRRKIANKNGIKVYVGTASQNKYLCDLARQGKLIKV